LLYNERSLPSSEVVSQIDELLEEDKESKNSSEESTHDPGNICPNVFHQ
jgi:hypothetical protein